MPQVAPFATTLATRRPPRQMDNPTQQKSVDADSYRAHIEHSERKDEPTGTQQACSLDAADDDLDELLTLLKNARRRGVIQLLAAYGPLDINTLTDQICARETGESPEKLPTKPRNAVYIGLYQSHIPKLDDAEIVDADDYPRLITPGKRFSEVCALLDTIEDVHGETANSAPTAESRAVSDPKTAHPQNLLGRKLRIDWGSRADIGEIRNVSDDIERGREIRIAIPNGDGGMSRSVTISPADHDITMITEGDD